MWGRLCLRKTALSVRGFGCPRQKSALCMPLTFSSPQVAFTPHYIGSLSSERRIKEYFCFSFSKSLCITLELTSQTQRELLGPEHRNPDGCSGYLLSKEQRVSGLCGEDRIFHCRKVKQGGVTWSLVSLVFCVCPSQLPQ